MDYGIMLLFAFVLIVWYIRPIYNVLAKRKYLLLDTEKLSLFQKVQTWLPALLFFMIVFGLMFVPALTNEIINSYEFASIFVLQIIAIFALTRFDKWQTKYEVTNEALKFKYRKIKWDEPYSVEFKKTVFVLLHKPRFIIRSKRMKIVVPMLSHEFKHFAHTIHSKNNMIGEHIYKIYENTKSYYVDNIEIVKQLNILGKKAD
jgi:hypothetical protein